MFWFQCKNKIGSQPRCPSRARSGRRRGIAALETAVTLPILAFLTFGSLELSNLIYLRQSMTIASYEGSRTVTRPGGSQALAQTRVQEVLNARGVTEFTVQFTPAVTTATARGTMVQVRVSSTNSSLTYAPFRLFTGSSVSSSTTMVRQ